MYIVLFNHKRKFFFLFTARNLNWIPDQASNKKVYTLRLHKSILP